MSTHQPISAARICAAVALVIFLFALGQCTVSYVQDAKAVVARSSR